MKKIYNFINKYKKEILFLIIIIILLIVIIYFYYRENFISEKFTGSTPLTNSTLKTAISAWMDSTTRENTVLVYGDIALWDVSQVTNMENMFEYNNSFNEDISR